MEVQQLLLKGPALIIPDVHGDARGFFMNIYNKDVFAQAGISLDIVEHNQSHSGKGTIRGLHFQWDSPLSKLVRVMHGKAFFVAVDIRKKSPTRAQWVAHELSSENKKLLWVPFGFATGFCTLEENTDLEYYFSAHYNSKGESNIAWNDPDIGILWPIQNPLLSERDKNAQRLKEWFVRPESDFIC